MRNFVRFYFTDGRYTQVESTMDSVIESLKSTNCDNKWIMVGKDEKGVSQVINIDEVIRIKKDD